MVDVYVNSRHQRGRHAAAFSYWLVFFTLLVSVNYFLYVYFYPFDQGVSGAPSAFHTVKYPLWWLTFIILLLRPRHVVFSSTNWLPMLWFMFLSALGGAHLIGYVSDGSSEEFIAAANIAAFSPALLLIPAKAWFQFFRVLPLLLIIQIGFSILAKLIGISLWRDDSIVGGFGNANSFGLALNIAILWVLYRERGKRRIFYLSILMLGLILTKSNSQILVVAITVSLYLFIEFRRKPASVLFIAGALIFSIWISWSCNLISKPVVIAVGSSIGGPFAEFADYVANKEGISPDVTSLSVGLREQIHKQAFHTVSQFSPIEIVLGDLERKKPWVFDSQFLMPFSNGGLILGMGFIFLIFATVIFGPRGGGPRGHFFRLAVLAYVVTFLFSRVLYYFPLNIIFFGIVAGLGSGWGRFAFDLRADRS